jgi:hypothetical protein
LGKIFDILGQRERALNEYNKARQTNDNTGGAQDVVEALIKKPYTENGMPTPSPTDAGTPAAPTKGKQAEVPAPASGEKPTLKRPNP